MRMRNPPHPGSVLRDFLGAWSVTEAARHLGITRVALSRILNGAAGISAEMALRLSEALGTSPELWLGMQSHYDLWQASKRRRRRVIPLGSKVPKVKIAGEVVRGATIADNRPSR